MKIKMLKSEKGSIDGFTIFLYDKGVEYDLPEELAVAFVSVGLAEEVVETMAEVETFETPEKPKRRRGRKPKK